MDSLLADLLELKIATEDSEKGVFEGYGSVFGNVDLGKDVCVKGCFTKSLLEHKDRGTLPSMLWMHKQDLPIGDWLDVREDEKGLYVKGRLWVGEGVAEADRAYKMLRGTGQKGLSIGFKTKASRLDTKAGVRHLMETDVKEISIVGLGMNPKAVVTTVKTERDADVRSLINLMTSATVGANLKLLTKSIDAARRRIHP